MMYLQQGIVLQSHYNVTSYKTSSQGSTDSNVTCLKCIFQVCMASRSYYLWPFPGPINICALGTSDFPFAAKKTATYCHSHQCKLHNYKCSEQIFILIQGGYEVTSCSSMEPNMGTPKLTDIQTRCSVFATHISGKRREIW